MLLLQKMKIEDTTICVLMVISLTNQVIKNAVDGLTVIECIQALIIQCIKIVPVAIFLAIYYLIFKETPTETFIKIGKKILKR